MCSFILQADILESQEQLCLLGVWSRKYVSLSISSFSVALRPSLHSAHLTLMQNIIYESHSINSFFHTIRYAEEITPSFQFPLRFLNLVSCLPSTVCFFSTLFTGCVFWACCSISSLRGLAKVCKEAAPKNSAPRIPNCLFTVCQAIAGTLNKLFIPHHRSVLILNNASIEWYILSMNIEIC